MGWVSELQLVSIFSEDNEIPACHCVIGLDWLPQPLGSPSKPPSIFYACPDFPHVEDTWHFHLAAPHPGSLPLSSEAGNTFTLCQFGFPSAFLALSTYTCRLTTSWLCVALGPTQSWLVMWRGLTGRSGWNQRFPGVRSAFRLSNRHTSPPNSQVKPLASQNVVYIPLMSKKIPNNFLWNKKRG